MSTVLLLGVAAGVGAAVRFWVAATVGGRRGTLLVNVAGCGLLGLLVAAPRPLAALAVGVAGGLTTFSTWAVETVEGGGLRYALGTTAACLLATALGLAVAAGAGWAAG
jgi:fluoride exporter